MADMNIAVGVWRPVMENEFLLALRLFAQTVIEVHRFPARQKFRLLLRQAAAHREIGLGQENGIAVIFFRFSHVCQGVQKIRILARPAGDKRRFSQ